MKPDRQAAMNALQGYTPAELAVARERVEKTSGAYDQFMTGIAGASLSLSVSVSALGGKQPGGVAAWLLVVAWALLLVSFVAGVVRLHLGVDWAVLKLRHLSKKSPQDTPEHRSVTRGLVWSLRVREAALVLGLAAIGVVRAICLLAG